MSIIKNNVVAYTPSGGTTVDLLDGLIAHYPLNEDSQANDWTTSYDGTAYNAPVYNDTYTDFNGSNQYIDFNNLALNGTTSVSFYIYYEGGLTGTFPYQAKTLICTRSTNEDIGWEIDLASVQDGINFESHELGVLVTNTYSNLTPVSSYLNVWKHICLVIDTSNIYVYVDNTLELQYSYTGVYDSSTKTGIARLLNRDYYYLNGKMSNLRIYNRALIRTEITALYAEGLKPSLPQPTTENLVAHYPLTGTAEDTTGNYNGTENGGLLYTDDSIRGSVADFDGSNDSVSVPNLGIDVSSNFSCSCWVKADNISNSPLIIQTDDGTGTGRSILRIGTSSGFYAFVGTTLATNFVPTLGVWYFVCVTYNSASKDYIITVNDTIYTFPNVSMDSNISSWHLAIFKDGTSYPLNGKISNLRIYNSALTADEIATIYKTERVEHPIAIDDGLVAYYPLENNSLDNYNNQYDGTNTNVAYDGTSVNISGDGAYVDTGLSISGSGEIWSISGWMKPNTISRTSGNILISKYAYNNDRMHLGFNTDAGGSLNLGYGNKYNTGTATQGGVVVNTWHHVVAVWDNPSGVFTVYLNGELYFQDTYTMTYTSANLQFGKSFLAYGTGNVANVRAYRRKLSIDEAKIIYNLEKTKFDLLSMPLWYIATTYESTVDGSTSADAPITITLDKTYTTGTLVIMASGDHILSAAGGSSYPNVRINNSSGTILTQRQFVEGDGGGLAYSYIGTFNISTPVSAIYFGNLLSQETAVVVYYIPSGATVLSSTSAYANDSNGTGTLTLTGLTGSKVLVLGTAGADAGGGYGTINEKNNWTTDAYASVSQDAIVNSYYMGTISSQSTTYTITSPDTSTTNELCMAAIALEII